MCPTGNDPPFSKTLEEIAGLVRRAIAAHCPPDLREDMEDIEQEARLRLWQAQERRLEPIEEPGRYAYRLAVNATLDAIRHARAKRRAMLRGEYDEGRVAGTDSPASQADRSEVLAMVTEFLDRQKPFVATAIGLHLQGLTTTEIGELLGCTEARARNQIYRGLKKLRWHLSQQGVEYEAES